MRMCLFAVRAAICVVASGCRQDPYVDTYLEMMRGEFIALEDDYFALEDDYDQAVRELETARNENDQLRGGLNGDMSSVDFDSAVQAVAYHEPADVRVTHIVVNPFLTSGHDFDHKPGDDGVSIIIEPRNADDQFVPVAGAVSISILDPALAGEDARVARWDIDAEECTARLRKSALRGRGINLKLPWQDQPPKHSKLHVFVRYETEDGRRLADDTEMFVALPGQVSNRWTPKSSASLARSNPPEHSQQATFQQPAMTIIDAEPAEDGLPPDTPNLEPEQVTPPRQSRRPEWSPYR